MNLLKRAIITATLYLYACTALSDASPLSTIVLIIDDMGNNLTLGEKALALPGSINYAFLPHRNTSAALAEKAHHLNKEILLHEPMSNIHKKPLGEGALTEQMEKQEFIKVLEASIDSVPHLRGVNNHMGSLLTRMPQQMGWLMGVLKERHLYFIDSRTSVETAAESMANFYQLPNLRRHVFLDNDRNMEAINIQFERLLKLATTQEVTVAIGHPYPETIQFLQQKLPSLQLRGYRLALVSEVIAKADCNAASFTAAIFKSPCQQPQSSLAIAQLPAALSPIN